MEEITRIIIDALTELNEELDEPTLISPTKETKLFGGAGVLDSLALVSFLADVEDKIAERFNVTLIIADEKAMSQTTSPFRNVESLASYISSRLSE